MKFEALPRHPSDHPGAPPGAAGRVERLLADLGPAEIEALRAALLGPEQKRLADLESRTTSAALSPQQVARVLPAAIRLRQQQDGQLDRALAPTLEGAIQDAVRREPSALAEAIFPVLGPAIRRAIGSALSSMVESFHGLLEASFSLRGLRWRLEARRTGRSFAEVALLHSIAWRTEQVLLVHRETGTLLLHTVAPWVEHSADGDVVSAMLGAIHDFVSDSFAGGAQTDLRRVAFDDRTLHVALGSKVMLVALVRGSPPRGFTDQLQETVDLVQELAVARLAAFRGDTAPFASLGHLLHDLMREERAARPTARRVLTVWAIGVMLLAGLGIAWIVQRSAESARIGQAAAALRATPGIVVVSAGRQGGEPTVVFMRDSGAASADEVLRGAGIDPSDLAVHEEPYVCLLPDFVLARAVQALAPPPTVQMTFDRGRLTARGTASHRWVTRVESLASTLAGVHTVDTASLVDIDEGRLTSGSYRLGGATVAFQEGGTQLAIDAAQQTDLRQTVQMLATGARAVGFVVRVEVLGSMTDAEALVDPSLAMMRARVAGNLIDGWTDRVLLVQAVDGRAEGRVAARAEVRFRVTLHGSER